jgi:hypothetical protein
VATLCLGDWQRFNMSGCRSSTENVIAGIHRSGHLLAAFFVFGWGAAARVDTRAEDTPESDRQMSARPAETVEAVRVEHAPKLDGTLDAGKSALIPSPGHPSGASDLGASLTYHSNWLEGLVVRRKTGPNFNPEVGFVERVDSNQTYEDFTFKTRPRITGVRELQFEGFLFHAPDTTGQVSTQEWQDTFRAEFNNGGYTDDDIVDVFTQRITTPFHLYKNVFIPVGLYHFARHQLTYGSGQDRKFTYNFFERFGSYYGGRLNEFRVRYNYRPTARFSISAAETWDRFRLPLANRNFSVVVASLQANYSFSRFLTFTTILPMDTSNTQAASSNLRLRYN